ncbi:MAG: sodium-dependent transporter, partial [Clostridia bacterium]|nr:sodium-dependent transporter [Clostridia bacterium]
MKRERLGSRLGFILLSAGCAIGCGNVWKFPWLTGQNGGGGFVLLYILCIIIIGLPVLTMELALGRASQASPVKMYQKLEKPGHKWHIHGYFALFGNVCLMSFYTTVAGWMIYYFYKFLVGQNMELSFGAMLSSTPVNVGFMAIVVAVGFLVVSFKLQGGLERITKYMMVALLGIMLVLAGRSFTMAGAAEGLQFYLVPDVSKITGTTVVAALNQAFFTLSLGIGSMAIFGSYLGKERSLLGESVSIAALDSIV